MKTTLLLLLSIMGLSTRGFSQPVITNQPQNQTAIAGSNATFTVGATGTPPLSYQWRSYANSTSFTNIPFGIEATLMLTNVQPTSRKFAVEVSNANGSVTSILARLVVEPVLAITGQPSDIIDTLAASRSFNATVNGTLPHSYQWFFNGIVLAGRTNSSLFIANIQTGHVGAYTMVVTSYFGEVATSRVAQLDLYPSTSSFETRVFTNELGRLPYRLFKPSGYDATNLYPMVLFLHGAGYAGTDNQMQLTESGEGAFKFVSYANQDRHPAFFVAPQHPADAFWSQTQMAELIYALLRQLEGEFSFDTNRFYVTGASDGGYGSWDFRYRSPKRFAAIIPLGSSFSPESAPFQTTAPVWHLQAEDDPETDLAELHALVDNIRANGGHPILTSYQRGGHGSQVWIPAYNTPPLVDWLMVQRRGWPDTNGPQLVISRPLSGNLVANRDVLDLTGTAWAFDQPVTRVRWTNLQNHLSGVASGTTTWSARIPLQTGVENVIVVIGETTSWVPALGGVTTFSDTLRVEAVPPISLAIRQEGPDVTLNWTGGTPPFHVEQATALAPANWENRLMTISNSARFSRNDAVAFHRVSSPYLTLSVGDVTLYEGDGDPTNAVFTVRLSAPADYWVSVDYETLDGTATAGSDYLPMSGTLSFNPGETSRTVSVPIVGDTNREVRELFWLLLTNAVNATAPYSPARCLLLDEDRPAIVSIDSVNVTEGNAGTNYAVLTVTLSAWQGLSTTVLYSTFDQSAVAPGDYTAVSGMLTFPPGTTTQTIRVPIKADGIPEADETFGIRLNDPRALMLPVANQVGICTIRNDD